MNCGEPSWLWPLTHLVTALVFLLLGWKFGREAAGRPMFEFPPGPSPCLDPGEEGDPWALAAVGPGGPDNGVDKNETLGLP